MGKRSGIVGFTEAFKECLSDVEDGSKIVFSGSVAVCTPFIELLAYAVRNKDFDMLFIPRANVQEARKIKESESVGHSIVEERGDPKEPDVIVVLGGLAMQKFGCPIEDVIQMIEDLSGDKKPKIIGVGFMGIFERKGWDKKIKFDAIIDTTMESIVKYYDKLY